MKIKEIAAVAVTATLLVTSVQSNAWAYGETSGSSTLVNDTKSITNYQAWKADTWTGKESVDTSKIILTPGESEKDLNFAWYSVGKGTPAVRISKNADMSSAKTFEGKATEINRSNGVNTYKAANKVTVNDIFEENTTYYYSYTDDYKTENIVWSEAAIYKTHETSNFQALLVGDPQIGASGSDGEGTADDINIAVDTYNWNKTLEKAQEIAENASFILSAGDQINYSNVDADDTKGVRESEFAGFSYPLILRNIPLATTIGNHESKGTDYKNHYNNPNTSDNLGSTNSGSDYYFSYGNTLIISLNSNNRNTVEHEELLKKAVASNSNAKWKVVMFHHDIYGSGQPHSDTDGANLRTLFAPLMDEFGIDVCFMGHDHSYARSYLMADGTAVDYGNSLAVNPEGTLYIAAGSASGSKFYKLATTKQYFVAERSNTQIPTFSTVDFSDNALTVKTYDYNGCKYAEDYTIYKTENKTSIKSLINKANSLNKSDYTEKTWTTLQNALDSANKLMQFTVKDEGAAKLSEVYDRTNDGNNDKDMLDYYGYAQGDYADAEAKSTKLKVGFSTLLDKTTVTDIKISEKAFTAQYNNVASAIVGLEKVKTTGSTSTNTSNQNATIKGTGIGIIQIKAAGKTIKAGKTITLKKGKSTKISVKVNNQKASGVKYKTANKKIVKVTKAGKLTAVKKSKKMVKITVTCNGQKTTFKVKVK